jgi:DMSO/TMAO reductase YedYZ molybdopterin-dependent catalytic subunit
MRFLRLSLLAFVLVVPALRGLAAEPVLKIVSPEKTLAFTAEAFAALPRTEVKLVDHHDQKERSFSGVAMRELLARAGAPLGDKLRGQAHLTGVIVRCKDNYAVLFALAEFDENFSARTIVLADKENGKALPPSAAPLRLVAPGDKRGARSARQVTAIEIVPLAKP